MRCKQSKDSLIAASLPVQVYNINTVGRLRGVYESRTQQDANVCERYSNKTSDNDSSTIKKRQHQHHLVDLRYPPVDLGSDGETIYCC